MHKYTRFLPLLMSLVPLVGSAQEEMSKAELRELLRVKIRTVQHLALNPTLVRAVRHQNDAGLSLAQIQQRDEEWKASDELTEFKLQLQRSKAGRFLQEHVSRESGSFNEAFLTDNLGANVAAYPATSDYWQGDEEKWTDSYRDGDGLLYLGPLEFDDSTQTYAVQVSAPVLDRGSTVGVLVVGVTLDYLKGKQGAQ